MENYCRQKMKEAAMKMAVLVEDTPWIEALKDDATKTTMEDILDAKAKVHRCGRGGAIL